MLFQIFLCRYKYTYYWIVIHRYHIFVCAIFQSEINTIHYTQSVRESNNRKLRRVKCEFLFLRFFTFGYSCYFISVRCRHIQLFIAHKSPAAMRYIRAQVKFSARPTIRFAIFYAMHKMGIGVWFSTRRVDTITADS